LKTASFQQVGILYDDHSLDPAEVKMIPSAITTMKSTREFNEEVVTAVYVSLAADACGWPIAAEQKSNLKRYISDVNTYGNFNDRSSLNGVMAKVRNGINDPSVHFCENASERQGFERRVATVWPKGHGSPRSGSQLALALHCGSDHDLWRLIGSVNRGVMGHPAQTADHTSSVLV